MNLDLKIYDNFKKYMISKKETTTYEGIRYKFNLGKYEVSVIKIDGSYGSWDDLWEVCIIKDEVRINTELLCNDEVMGYLTDKEVNLILYCVENELLNVSFNKIRDAIEVFNNI